jgi:uncharacterized protein
VIGGEIFVDTSGLYALIDADDHQHADAVTRFLPLLDQHERRGLRLVTHGSVLVESAALVQRRLGMQHTRNLLSRLVPLLDVVWVDADLHQRAVEALLAAGRRGVSLVDWTSFLVMRDRAIDVAFAFDDDFVDQGFELYSP